MVGADSAPQKMHVVMRIVLNRTSYYTDLYITVFVMLDRKEVYPIAKMIH